MINRININEICARTRYMLYERDMSLYRYSRIIGLTHVSLKNILTGRTPNPTCSTVNKLLAGLEVLEVLAQDDDKEKADKTA